MEGKPHRPQVQCWFILASFILKSLDWRLLISGSVPTTDYPYNQVNNKQLRRFLIYSFIPQYFTFSLTLSYFCSHLTKVRSINYHKQMLKLLFSLLSQCVGRLFSCSFSSETHLLHLQRNFFWKLSNLRWHSSDFWRVTEIPKKRAAVDSLFC